MEQEREKKEPGIQPQSGPNSKKNRKTKTTSRQIVALAGVVLLVLLYLVMLAAAILDSTAAAQWFRICLAATVVLPVLIWVYSWMYSRLTGKSAIGDPREPDFTQDIPSDSDSSGFPPSGGE